MPRQVQLCPAGSNSCSTVPIEPRSSSFCDCHAAQATAETLRILGVVGPRLHKALQPRLATLLPGLAASCAHADMHVQAAAAACARSLVAAAPAAVLPTLLRCACSCWCSCLGPPYPL